MAETYEATRIVVGVLQKQSVLSVEMSRERFLGIVRATLDRDAAYEPIRDEVLAVARTMSRFPMATWIDPIRGCGCVVGEYLVARAEVDRAALASTVGTRQSAEVITMLDDNPNGKALFDFGGAIDDALYTEIGELAADSIEIVG